MAIELSFVALTLILFDLFTDMAGFFFKIPDGRHRNRFTFFTHISLQGFTQAIFIVRD